MPLQPQQVQTPYKYLLSEFVKVERLSCFSVKVGMEKKEVMVARRMKPMERQMMAANGKIVCD